MILTIPLSWLQLKQDRLRLLVAVLGVGFAVMLVFMQLGFQEALFSSSVRFHHAFDYDLAMIHPRTDFLVQPRSFTRRRLVQTLGFPEVESVSPVYLGQSIWMNPLEHGEGRSIFVVGYDPSESVLRVPEVAAHGAPLRLPDRVLFDRASRPEFGPVSRLLEESRSRGDSDPGVFTEVGGRRIQVVDTYELGTSFGIDASLVTSDLNFLRLFPDRAPGLIDLGLIRLADGADALATRDQLDAALPDDVVVLTRQGFIDREVAYWSRNTAIGTVFSFGVVIGIVVGSIIVYQILFADVSDHLNEYATLKAIGYSNGFLSRLVFQEAVILAVLGYLPGISLSLWLYRAAGASTHLPIEMNGPRAGGVLALTVGMCVLAGSIAIRKVRRVDPADVF